MLTVTQGYEEKAKKVFTQAFLSVTAMLVLIFGFVLMAKGCG